MHSDQDPIVAIATAPGRGGVGIIRLSGNDKTILALIAKLFGEDFSIKPRFAHYKVFKDDKGEVIDDGLVLYFKEPKSYTGESTLELQAHGGPVVLQVLLSRVLKLGKEYGLRLAEPGEFTRRAFLNGRLDLSQAEAVADLIDATTEGAVRAASRSLRGLFSKHVHELGDQIIELRALIEAILDFPEEEIDFIHSTQVKERLNRILSDFEHLMEQSKQGSILREGIKVVLVGSPNVGKSSLMNVLSGDDVAIVTDVAGTTRDKIEYGIQIQGVAIRLIDTAGIRETHDKVEAIGIERTFKAIEDADVVIHLLDATHSVNDVEGKKILDKVMNRVRRDIPIINLLNKCDLVQNIEEVDSSVLKISAKTGYGIDKLKNKLLDIVGWTNNPEPIFLARERHIQALTYTGEHLKRADQFLLLDNPPLDLIAEELRLANESLGEIIGVTTPDDILGLIFSRFCIGK